MDTSPTIGLLAAALAKAQGAMEGAKKDSDNPFFKSKYADLESVWRACREPLAANGLAVIQSDSADDTCVIVTTMLAHESGEWVRDSLRLVPADMSPQKIGTAIAYGRRYSLASFVGVFQIDDDGNESSGKVRQPHYQPQGHPAADKAAAKFRDALEVGIDQAVYDIHCEVVQDDELYKAVGAILTANERARLKDSVDRVRAEMRAAKPMLPNGRQAVVR